jgi:hypothetical protein
LLNTQLNALITIEMTAKKGDPKPKKRETKQAEKAAVKKETKSKTPSKGKNLCSEIAIFDVWIK